MIRYETPKIEIVYFDETTINTLSVQNVTAAENLNAAAFQPAPQANGGGGTATIGAAATRTVRLNTILQFQ